jgi:hypothetical protein
MTSSRRSRPVTLCAEARDGRGVARTDA